MKRAEVNKQTNEQTKANRRCEQNPLITWCMARLPIGDTEDKRLVPSHSLCWLFSRGI